MLALASLILGYMYPYRMKVEFARAMEVRTITAYSGIDSCHFENCIMSNGERAHIGAIACPREWKTGTKVKIEDKIYTCKDRTAQRYNGRIDVFMGYGRESHNNAIDFGIKIMGVEMVR